MDDLDDILAEKPEERREIPDCALCGTCNTYPAYWQSDGWSCKRGARTVRASDFACHWWSPRDPGRPSVPLFSSLSEHRDRIARQQTLIALQYSADPPDQQWPVGYVYFARIHEFIKIGHARNVAIRISSIHTSTPYDVELIGFIEGGMDLERQMHARFRRCHHKREWFKPDAAMLEEIADILAQKRELPR